MIEIGSRPFGRRLTVGVSFLALLAASVPLATAADINFTGNGVSQWNGGSSWQGGVVPGAGDRAVFAAGPASVLLNSPFTATRDLGSLWIREGSTVARFGNESMQTMRLHGTSDGNEVIGALNENSNLVWFFRSTIIENDLTIRASNSLGGGFQFITGVVPSGAPRGLDLAGNTVTFDTVYASNLISFVSGMSIRGAGDIVKTGLGTLQLGSISEFTGTTTVLDGTLELTGAGSIASSSALDVAAAGLFDISAVTGAGASIQALLGNGLVELGAKTLTITAASDTFSGVIQGGGGLTIAGGQQTLTGENTYGGLTTIDAGAFLYLGNGGAGGSVAGDVFADGTLVFNRSDDLDFSGVITGSGAVNQLGFGMAALNTDSSAFAGLSTVYAGTLQVNGTLGGLMDVRGGRLQGLGMVGDTVNYAGGTIAPGNSIGSLIVDGQYTSEGGALEIEAELGDDLSASDLLIITGNSLLGVGGATQVRVINVGGTGALTAGDGIKIVDVQGPTSDIGAFVMSGPAIGGVYRYDLFQNDLTGTQDDGDWYLRSTGLAPTLPTYESYPVVMLGLVDLPTLRQRVGDRQELYAGGEAGQAASGVWTRIEAAHARVEGDSTLGLSYDSNRYLIQAGIDGQFLDTGSSSLLAGVNVQYGRDSADIASSVGDGRNGTDSFGAGATLTWYGADGFYVDGQAQVAALRSKLSADEVGTIEDNLKGAGYALGIEAGRSFGLRDGWALTPQAQLVYTAVDFDDFTDPFGADVSLRNGDSLKGRLGMALERASAGGSYYGLANLTYEFLDGTSVDVSGETLDFRPDAFGAELGAGGNYAWAGGKYALYGEALVRSSFEGSYGVKGTVGLTSKF